MTASASTSVPNGSPVRCATTSAWCTAACTAAISATAQATSRNVTPGHSNAAPSSARADNGTIRAQRGTASLSAGLLTTTGGPALCLRAPGYRVGSGLCKAGARAGSRASSTSRTITSANALLAWMALLAPSLSSNSASSPLAARTITGMPGVQRAGGLDHRTHVGAVGRGHHQHAGIGDVRLHQRRGIAGVARHRMHAALRSASTRSRFWSTTMNGTSRAANIAGRCAGRPSRSRPAPPAWPGSVDRWTTAVRPADRRAPRAGAPPPSAPGSTAGPARRARTSAD